MTPDFFKENSCLNAITPRLTQYQASKYAPTETQASYKSTRIPQRSQYLTDIDSIAMDKWSALSYPVSGQNLPANDGFVFN